MNKYAMSWVIGASSESTGGNVINSVWSNIRQMLAKVNDQAGVLTLSKIDGPEFGPQNLQVQTEGGFSVISLGEDNEEEYVIRSFVNDSAIPGVIRILGNEWDRRMVCADFQVVYRVFENFFNSGDVARELLS